MPVDYGLIFYAQAFLLFWAFISLFLAVMAYDRSKRFGIGTPRYWGLAMLFTGAVGYALLVYLCRKKGPQKETIDKEERQASKPEKEGPKPGPEDPEKERERELVKKKMETFYLALFLLPMISFLFPNSEALVNFYMLSLVYFVMVYAIKEEFESLPLVPRQWEVILGALVIASSFLLTNLKLMVVPETRDYGMVNFGVLLIGATLSFFGISNYRISAVKAIALGGGVVLVFIALLKFSFDLNVLVVLVVGLVLMAYGIQKIRPIFMPPVIVLSLAFINTGFYESQELIDAATKYLAPFVSQFSTWFTSLFGYDNVARAVVVNDKTAWTIVFNGSGFTDSVGVAGNCTGIVGAMFYGVISIAMLIWVKCEWWRKLAIVIGGIMGSFITNLFRVVTLILVYWNFDYPTPQHSVMSHLWYVHLYLGDILYIVFISLYWLFAFKYLLPVPVQEGSARPTKAERIVYAPWSRRRDARVVKTSAEPGRKRKQIRRMKRRRRLRDEPRSGDTSER
jgi:exosortase/archaeosortase family protein